MLSCLPQARYTTLQQNLSLGIVRTCDTKWAIQSGQRWLGCSHEIDRILSMGACLEAVHDNLFNNIRRCYIVRYTAVLLSSTRNAGLSFLLHDLLLWGR